MGGDDSHTEITSDRQSGGITAQNVTINGGSLLATEPPDKPPPWWKSTAALIMWLLTVGASIVAILTYFHFEPKERGMSGDKKISVTSFNQSGGITAHTVNIGSQNRTLSDPQMASLKAQILRDLPKAKPITVTALMGDTESYRFAAEIHAYLKANGFRLTEDGISQGVFMPPPVGLGVNDKGDHLEFIVGSKQ